MEAAAPALEAPPTLGRYLTLSLSSSPLILLADSPAYETSQLYCADAFRGKESGLLGRPW